jgi:hypothetical protein
LVLVIADPVCRHPPGARLLRATKDINKGCLARIYELWRQSESRAAKIMAGKKPARGCCVILG